MIMGEMNLVEMISQAFEAQFQQVYDQATP
jgi:hypothetical protein